MQNVVIGKDLNLGVIGSFFMFSPYGDPLCVITLYSFYRWSFFNLNHVKTTKDFHNVFGYYGKT